MLKEIVRFQHDMFSDNIYCIDGKYLKVESYEGNQEAAIIDKNEVERIINMWYEFFEDYTLSTDHISVGKTNIETYTDRSEVFQFLVDIDHISNKKLKEKLIDMFKLLENISKLDKNYLAGKNTKVITSKLHKAICSCNKFKIEPA